MIQANTAAYRRYEIRNVAAARIAAALVADFAALAVYAAQADSDSVQDFVSVYFDDTERERTHSAADTTAELIVRISTSIQADQADDRLDEIASYIEVDLAGAKLIDYVWDCVLAGTANTVAPNGAYSSLELRYELKYDD